MATKMQIKANRENATKSTGPKTKKGKSVARYNALDHGLTAANVVLPGEDIIAFQELLDGLQAEFEPEGAMEELLVHLIAVDSWRSIRARKVDAGLFIMQRYRAEHRDAVAEAKKHTIIRDIVSLSSLDSIEEIVDQANYDAAMKKAADIERLMEDELPTLGSQFAEDAAGPNVFAKLARYERAIENSLYRALYELRRRQAARGKQDLSPMLAVDVTPAAT